MKLTPKKVKCTWPMPKFCVGTQRNLYSTGLHLGFASGKTQLLGFAFYPTRNLKFVSPNAKDINMLVRKVLSFALGDAKVPNASSFGRS